MTPLPAVPANSFELEASNTKDKTCVPGNPDEISDHVAPRSELARAEFIMGISKLYVDAA